MAMTEEQLQRYARHTVLQGVGAEGQERIMASSALIVGAGGLGSPAALYLAAAGVGRIGLADADCVSLSNLQRQVIHTTADVGRAKVDSAREKMLAVNPGVRVDTYRAMLTPGNAGQIIGGYDFIIDATDNFGAKFLINDVCTAQGKPFSYAGVLRFAGQAMTHLPGTACLRCLYGGEPPAGEVPSGEEAGVLGSVVGILGTVQATEALKFFSGAGSLLAGRLLAVDALTMQFRTLSVAKAAACPACGSRQGATKRNETLTEKTNGK